MANENDFTTTNGFDPTKDSPPAPVQPLNNNQQPSYADSQFTLAERQKQDFERALAAKQHGEPPSVSDHTVTPLDPHAPLPPGASQGRTKLHEVMNQFWGEPWVDEDAYNSLIKYADPNKAKAVQQYGLRDRKAMVKGFVLELEDGGVLKWNPPEDQYDTEKILSVSRNFSQQTADAMVAMARLHHWKTLTVTGTVKEKEMLWLATMRQNLLDKEAYDKKYADCEVDGENNKLDKDGNKIPAYVELKVSNFHPLADSEVYRTWVAEKLAYDQLHGPRLENADATPPEQPAPVEGPSITGEEAPTPVLDTGAAAEAPIPAAVTATDTQIPRPTEPLDTWTTQVSAAAIVKEKEKKFLPLSKFMKQQPKKGSPSGSKYMAPPQPTAKDTSELSKKEKDALVHKNRKQRGGARKQRQQQKQAVKPVGK